MHLKHSWHRLDINMTTAHSHVSIVINAVGGWWLGISIVTEADEWSLFFTLPVVGKMSLQHKEGSLSWIINQFHMRGAPSTAVSTYQEDDVMLGDWLGWCHPGGMMSPLFLNTSDMAAEQFPCVKCKLLFTYLYLWRMQFYQKSQINWAIKATPETSSNAVCLPSEE